MKVNFAIILMLLTGCFLADELPPDQSIWAYDLPRNQQMNQANLSAINSFIRTGQYENIRSLMILRNDKLVFENHYINGERNQPRNIDRLTLIFTQLAIGMAISEGLIDSVQIPIHHLLPSYAISFEEDPAKKDITLQQLLVHTSGFSWNESVLSSVSENNDINLMLEATDAAGYLVRKPLEALPGTRFNYNSGSGFLLSKIIQETTGESLHDFLTQRLFQPLAIETFSWSEDRSGVTNGSNGLEMSPFDLLKIGQLHLNEGLWDGEEIIPFAWFNESTTAQLFITNQYGFSYYWNKLNPSFQRVFFGSQADKLIYMVGNSGDALYILPEENLAIVIYAENLFFGFYSPSFFLFSDILASLL